MWTIKSTVSCAHSSDSFHSNVCVCSVHIAMRLNQQIWCRYVRMYVVPLKSARCDAKPVSGCMKCTKTATKNRNKTVALNHWTRLHVVRRQTAPQQLCAASIPHPTLSAAELTAHCSFLFQFKPTNTPTFESRAVRFALVWLFIAPIHRQFHYLL